MSTLSDLVRHLSGPTTALLLLAAAVGPTSGSGEGIRPNEGAADVRHTMATPPVPIAPHSDTLPFDADRLLADLAVLAHDTMQGRRTGTDGNARARDFLVRAFDERGIARLAGTRTRSFSVPATSDGLVGTNVLGLVEGTERPSRYIVVTAHYDHLGTRGGEVFNGADDNASGVAALLALAETLLDEPPRHSVVLAALDAEEMGLVGARAFVSDPPIPLDSILLNVNLDMVSRSGEGELYVAGTRHYPALRPLVEEVAEGAQVSLLMGHDSPDLPPGDDWTTASDHAPFHEAGIPFAYFGVEDHPGYHRPSDTVENITPDFYVGAVSTIVEFVRLVDRQSSDLDRVADRAPRDFRNLRVGTVCSC